MILERLHIKNGVRNFQGIPLTMANCVLWLDSNDGKTITSSSGSVLQWDDKSRNGNNATQISAGEQPETDSRTINSKNALDFASDEMDLPADVRTALSLTKDFTVIAVVACDNPSASSPGSTIMGASQSANDRFVMQISTNLIEVGHYTGSSYVKKSGTLDDTNQHVITVTHAASAIPDLYLDGVELLASSAPGLNAFSSAAAKIGSDDTGTDRYFDGLISEVIIYDRVLSSSELNIVEVYLADKWGTYHPNAIWINAFTSDEQILINALKLTKDQAFKNSSSNPIIGWFDASDSSTITHDASVSASSGLVSQWANKSGRTTFNTSIDQGTETNQPLYEEDGDSNPGIHFDGSDDYVSGSYTGSVTDNTVFVACRLDTLTPSESGPGLFTIELSGGFDSLVYNEYTAKRWMNGSNGFERTPDTVSSTDETSTDVLIMAITRQTSEYKIYRNGTEISTTTSYSPPTLTNGLFISGWRHIGGGSGNFDGFIYEIIVINDVISSSARSAINTYLTDKWGA